MFETRNILYFKPFYFKSGNTAKNKYLVVIKVLEDKTVLASLPTSKDHIPSYHNAVDGCVELPEINFNCFAISTKTCVTECGKHMLRDTFLYGHQLDTYEKQQMEQIYPLENINYEVWGKMRQDLFDDLLCCFRNSKTIKRKYIRMLSQ